jgi:tRNA(Arg) A34 adenosine deaminase TadA
VCAPLFLVLGGSRALDSYSGQSDEHRLGWVERRLLFLSTLFAIDICAYAVMSNHVHVVVHVDKDEANAWAVDEVLRRYHKLHQGALLTHKYARVMN